MSDATMALRWAGHSVPQTVQLSAEKKVLLTAVQTAPQTDDRTAGLRDDRWALQMDR